MKTAQRVLAMIALLALVTQTVRHIYVRWLQPRTSVLDRFDRPLRDRISSAESLDELLRLYEPVRQNADLKRKESRAQRTERFVPEANDEEPFRSEHELRQAIESWEARAKELRALQFYWLVGLVLVGIGAYSFGRTNRWLGLSLEVIGFSEIAYWTSPTFFGGGQEFDKLVTYKVVLSLVSLAALALVVWRQRVFAESQDSSGAV